MNHPDDDGQPTFVPEGTRDLDVGEKIEILGYRTVKASQKGLYRRYSRIR
jgi:hypothetical protein